MNALRSKYLRYAFYSFLGLAALGGASVVALYLYLEPNLPSTESLKDVRFQVPLRVYSADNKLVAEFGDKRRVPLKYKDVPDIMIKAVLGAEDDRFFEHPGVDYQGILRAFYLLATTGEKAQGGSTITMQVARNFFLSREKTFLRKFTEILLSLQIEKELTKQEILELYLNQIYLGNHAYGFAAAAKVYYGKDIHELQIAQWATLAGLPKAPSKCNPVDGPRCSLNRRNYVLNRLLELKHINKEAYNTAITQPETARLHLQAPDIEANYAAEMARTEAFNRFGEAAYTDGYNVYTTLNSRFQTAANNALRNAVLDYEARHAYRGPEKHIDPLDATYADLKSVLTEQPILYGMEAGVVIANADGTLYIQLQSGDIATLCRKSLDWANTWAGRNRTGDALQVGDLIRVRRSSTNAWLLTQAPQIEGSLVSLRPQDGAVLSLVGGFDFNRSKFNRVTQGKRQPGSGFKPFIYSSALEKGFTAATLINDAPVVFDDPSLEDTWRPENFSGEFFGPTRLREAMVHSRNLVSIRILRQIGIDYAIDYAARFGFNPADMPRNLSVSLGTGSQTPMEMVRGYATFANGGHLITPYLVTRIDGPDGKTLYRADPETVCDECEAAEAAAAQAQAPASTPVEAAAPTDGSAVATDTPPPAPVAKKPAHPFAKRVIAADNAYIMTTIMRDVVQRGTARAALSLGRHDIGGKTGTTNDQKDAWFNGFSPTVVTTTWIGFDDPQPLGEQETGGRASLPMWIDYMREALKDVPEQALRQPPGLVTVRIDPESGLLAGSNIPNAIFEVFRADTVPTETARRGGTKSPGASGGAGGATPPPEELF